MNRKIIQILDTQDNGNYQGCLTALCDDGSIWFFQGEWEPLLKQIPQDVVETRKKKDNNSAKTILKKTISRIEDLRTNYLLHEQRVAADHMKKRVLAEIQSTLDNISEGRNE